jgi:flagella basal body P-ring formation protein FlgA
METNRWFFGSLLIYCGLATPIRATADEAIQPLDTIQRQVYEFLAAQHQNRAEPPEIRTNNLDPRLRLPKCGAALEAFLPGGAKPVGNTSVGVHCPGPRPWTVYQRASVRIFDQVLVASRFLAKGTILSATDLKTERRELSALPDGHETIPENLLGKQLRRALTAGAVVAPQAVKAIPLIRQGETVTLVIRQGGMEVSSSGVALSDAELGQRLRVRNEASKRVVEGTVTASHRVEIGR